MRIVVIPKMQGTGFRRKKMSSIQRHPYHLVDASPWPIVSSLSALVTATGAAMFMHSFQNGEKILFLGLFMVISSMSV
jgi:cytochrome c oxidase subunit 3